MILRKSRVAIPTYLSRSLIIRKTKPLDTEPLATLLLLGFGGSFSAVPGLGLSWEPWDFVQGLLL